MGQSEGLAERCQHLQEAPDSVGSDSLRFSSHSFCPVTWLRTLKAPTRGACGFPAGNPDNRGRPPRRLLAAVAQLAAKDAAPLSSIFLISSDRKSTRLNSSHITR